MSQFSERLQHKATGLVATISRDDQCGKWRAVLNTGEVSPHCRNKTAVYSWLRQIAAYYVFQNVQF